jgi:hypothetical protein
MYPMRDRPHRTIGLASRKGSTRVEEFALLGDFMKHNQLAGVSNLLRLDRAAAKLIGVPRHH